MQTELIPAQHPVGELAMIPTDALPAPLIRAPAALRESIASIGILQPLALIRSNDGISFRYADGQRRADAARTADLPEVPALIFPPATPRHVARAMTLMTNHVRADNPVTELDAIENLLEDGFSLREIADGLQIPVPTIEARMRLSSLAPALRHALEQGTIATGVAEAAAKLTSEEQNDLTATLLETGKVRGRDIRELKQARTAAATTQLPDAIFAADPPANPVTPPNAPDDHLTAALDALQTAHRLLPPAPYLAIDGLHQAVADALQHLTEYLQHTTSEDR